MRTPPNIAIGVVVALFVVGVAKMTTVAVVESCGLLKAGHATQSRCSAAMTAAQ